MQCPDAGAHDPAALCGGLGISAAFRAGAPEYIFPVDSSLFLGADGYLDLSIDGLDDINFLSWMAIFFSAICNATIALPFMLANLGVPNILIPLLVVPAYYTYLAAGFQLVTGRTLPFFS